MSSQVTLSTSPRRLLLGFFASLLILLLCGCGDDPAPAKSTEPPIKMTSGELSKAYNANEVAADNSYKGKKLLIYGRIVSISKDAMDDIYILLRGKDEFTDVHIALSDANVAAKLKKGQLVKVQGEGAGMILGSPIVSNGKVLEVAIEK